MFVGHYTDSKDKHDERRVGGLLPGEPPDGDMLTWRNLYKMVDQAGIGREEMFFTNVYVGLSAKTGARGPFPGRRDPSFTAWCAAFLDEQIQLMRPRSVVTLGYPAARVLGWPRGLLGTKERAGVTFKAAALLHPSAEFYLRKLRVETGDVEWAHEVRVLEEVSVA